MSTNQAVIRVSQIASFLGGTDSAIGLLSNSENWISEPAPLSEPRPSTVTYMTAHSTTSAESPEYSSFDRMLLIADNRLHDRLSATSLPPTTTVVFSPRPRFDFIRVVREFFAPRLPEPALSPQAVIDNDTRIADDVFIGPLCSVSKGVIIESGCVIHAGVHIYPQVRIGRNVTIHSGVIIGSEGFGYERSDEGELIRFPHLGSVTIGDNVEIGANTCVDRGALGDTVIGNGVRIDNLVHVGHNVRLAANVAVAANAMLGGILDWTEHDYTRRNRDWSRSVRRVRFTGHQERPCELHGGRCARPAN